MNEIRLLSGSMINKIAAGEVIERPFSVVKELVENSVDSGASAVTVEIKDGGTTLIRVTDNGSGISAAQVEIAFINHATSKIIDMDGLENVLTLGFRGEALSSIAAVSSVEIITKTAMEIMGTRMEIDGGVVKNKTGVGAAEGTTIFTRNLFYNIPARRKFLKKPSTEAGYVSDYINRAAMAHPEISFSFINDNDVVLRTNGNNDLKTVIFHVYGGDTVKRLIPLKYKNDDFSLSGYIGKPELARGNRSHENFFINGRYIKNELLQSAAEDAFKTKLMTGKYPVFIAHMSINPILMDVNVHPAKLEVRFVHEDKIYSGVYEAFSSMLADNNLVPSVRLPVKKFILNEVVDDYKIEEKQFKIIPGKTDLPLEDIPTDTFTGDYMSLKEEYDPPVSFINTIYPVVNNDMSNEADCGKISEAKTDITAVEQTVINEHYEKAVSEKSDDYSAKDDLFKNYNIMGRAFGAYWIIEQNESLYLIDQHAAHERILYEEYLAKFKDSTVTSQILLHPHKIRLTDSEMDIIKENKELFDKCGFDFELTGRSSIVVNAVPYALLSPESSGLIMELVDALKKTGSQVNDIYDFKLSAVASVSCKAAVKAGGKLTETEAEVMIKKLLALENPFTCPHGRPTIIEITKYELEKKFKRTAVK